MKNLEVVEHVGEIRPWRVQDDFASELLNRNVLTDDLLLDGKRMERFQSRADVQMPMQLGLSR